MTDPRIAALADAIFLAHVDVMETDTRKWLDSDQAAAAILAALPPDWCGHQREKEAVLLTYDRDQAEIVRLRRIEEAARGVYNCCYWTETCREHDALRAALEEKP